MMGGARLWVITSYFNPMGWSRRLANYRGFRRHIGAPLVTVELGHNGRFDLAENEADIVVRVRSGDVLWQKERLLNIALRSLPKECEHVAWVDCDVIFEHSTWALEAARRLGDVSLLQLFDELVHLRRDWTEGMPPEQCMLIRQRATASTIHDARESAARLAGSIDRDADCTVNGIAWAARRSLLDACGFFDRAIVGGGDTAMIGAAYGVPEAVVELHAMNGLQAERYREWAKPFGAAVGGGVSSMPGRALHLWHGDLQDRSARRRHMGLRPFDFDPDRDIALNTHGAWMWASDKPMLHEYVRRYLASRAEDGLPQAAESAAQERPVSEPP